MLSIGQAVVAAASMVLVIVFCRALPFVFFSKGKPPAYLAFLEDYMPALAMTVLAVSSYTGLDWKSSPWGIPELVAGLCVALLHLWKRNALLSILGGTLLYMGLSGIMAH
ncbi:MAG TPA: AzlD domain-containing protein [Rectinemataceae bacterium]